MKLNFTENFYLLDLCEMWKLKKEDIEFLLKNVKNFENLLQKKELNYPVKTL